MRDDGGERGEAAPRAANKRQLPFASEGGEGVWEKRTLRSLLKIGIIWTSSLMHSVAQLQLIVFNSSTGAG